MLGVPEFHLKDFWFIIIPALIFGAGFVILLVGILTGSPDIPKEESPQPHREIPKKIKPMPGPPEPKAEWTNG